MIFKENFLKIDLQRIFVKIFIKILIATHKKQSWNWFSKKNMFTEIFKAIIWTTHWAAKQQISWVIAPWWIFIPFLWPSGSLLLPSFQLFEMSLPIMFSSSIPLSFTHSSMKFQSVAAELMHDMIHADFWQPLQLFLFDIIERTSSREKHVPSDTDHCTCTSQWFNRMQVEFYMQCLTNLLINMKRMVFSVCFDVHKVTLHFDKVLQFV